MGLIKIALDTRDNVGVQGSMKAKVKDTNY